MAIGITCADCDWFNRIWPLVDFVGGQIMTTRMALVIIELVITFGLLNTFIFYQHLTLNEGRAVCEIHFYERSLTSDRLYLDCLEQYHWFIGE